METKYRVFSVVSLIALVTGLAFVAPTPSPAQTPQTPTVVRIYFGDQDQLNAVAGELDIWEVHLDDGYAVAAVKPAEYQWLQSLGYRLEIDAAKTELLGIQAPLDPRFYYFDDYYPNSYGRYVKNFLQDVAFAYGDITELYDAGNAWQGDHSGYLRDMWVLRITSEDPAYGDIANKPAFFMHAQIHAREVATPELLIRYIKYLTSGYNGLGGYNTDPDVTWLVNHNVAYVMVMANPDGHVPNEQNTGANRRKNMDNDDGCTDPNTWGVDLNRNHSFKWGCCGGSSGSPCAETYRGPSRGSEPETSAFQDFFASVMLDQNGNNGDDEIPPAAPDNAMGTFLSLHSYQDEVLWPWGFTTSQPPNYSQLRTIGRKLGYYTGFTPTQFLYTVDGDTHDWVYGKFGIAAYTYEVGPTSGSCGGFFPNFGCMEGTDGMTRNFWGETRSSFIFLHKIARTPYMTSYGPDTQNLAVSPASVPQGTPIQLTGNVEDHRYGGDTKTNVAAAEYFLDAPGTDGAGIAMAASDGSFGGASENVQATVDTSGLSVGRHYILVHGKGTNDFWGPFTAIFIEITPGACDPVTNAAFTWSPTSPFVGDVVSFQGSASGTAPISYAWTFGDGGTASGQNVTHTYTAAGTYTVSMTASNACGQQTVQHSVTVQPVATNTLHLNKAKMNWAPAARPGLYKIVYVGRVHDQNHAVVGGVLVTGVYTYPDNSQHTVTYTSTSLGQFKFAIKVWGTGVYQLCVTNMQKAGYAFDPNYGEWPLCMSVTVTP